MKNVTIIYKDGSACCFKAEKVTLWMGFVNLFRNGKPFFSIQSNVVYSIFIDGEEVAI